MKKITLLTILLVAVASFSYAQSSATYRIVFDSNWSQDAHPHGSGSLPSSAHWSRLVGATHNEDITFYEIGGIATDGIEDVAESGANTTFFSEINAAITAGNANTAINGPALNAAGGQIVIDEIETSEDFPLLTLVSMIAPSPDWIIGVSNLNLLDTNGEWKESIVLDVYPIDAGTDSGADYTSSNADTNPREAIAEVRGVAPFSSAPIGSFTIQRTSVILSTNDITRVNVSVFPNPFTNNIQIKASAKIKAVEIYNVLGKQVASYSRQTNLDVSNLTSGVYLLRATDINNNVTTKKIIKR